MDFARVAAIAGLAMCALWISPSLAAAQCGDGTRLGDEECDGDDLSGVECTDLGYGGGPLACADDCTFDNALCFGCGDGQLNPGEECDGVELGEQSCLDLGFTGGNVACAANCTYDDSGCSMCGDGAIDRQEECDGDDLGGQSCVTQGYDDGQLRCASDCTFGTGECSNMGCGNGTRDEGEECDSEDLSGQTCESLGYRRGALACSRACTFNVVECEGTSTLNCGDESIDRGEECDTENYDGQSCADFGLVDGRLYCTTRCTVDLTACLDPTGDVGSPDVGADVPIDIRIPGDIIVYEEIDVSVSPPPDISIGCCGPATVAAGPNPRSGSSLVLGALVVLGCTPPRKRRI